MTSRKTCALFNTSITYAMLDLVMPFYLQHVLRLSPAYIGLVFLASPVLVVLLSPMAGALTDRFGPRTPATWGIMATTTAYILGARLDVETSWITPFVMITLTGIGLAFFTSANQAAIISSVPAQDRSLAAGMMQTMFGLAHLVGVAVGSALLGASSQRHAGAGDSGLSLLGHSVAFAASTSRVFQVCVVLGLVAMTASLLRGRSRLGETRVAVGPDSPLKQGGTEPA